MGQVPKNNIIKALEGATLTLKVNGVLKKVPVEKADEAMAKEADRLIDAGELRPSEKVAYMNSWNKVKDMSGTGEFSIDTAGKDFVSDIDYKGAPTSFGMVNGKASERGRFGSAFTKKPRRDNMTDIEGIVNRTAFSQLGRLSLEGDEAETAAKTKEAAMAAQKIKDADTKKTETSTPDEWASAPLQTWYGKQFGGEGDFSQSLMALPKEEREAMMRRHAETIMPNWSKYKSLQGTNADWASKYRDATGATTYTPEFFKDFYSRGWSDEGLKFYNALSGIDPETGLPTDQVLTDEEKAAKEAAAKTEGIRARDEELTWKKHISRTDLDKVDDNTLEFKGKKVLKSDRSRKFIRSFVFDPATKTIKERLVESPSSSLKYNPLEMPLDKNRSTIYEKRPDPRDGKEFYYSKDNPEDFMNPEDFEDELPSVFKEGGTIEKFQSGGSTLSSGAQALEATLPNRNVGSTKTSTVAKSTETGKTKPPVDRTESMPATTDDHSAKIADMHFNTADVLDATSLIGDIVGLGASFVPGGSLVAGGAGLAGTFAAMGAEGSRGELGAEDIGKYALSLGLDAASFLPGVGLGAKVAKMSKAAPKLVSLLTKAAELGMAGYGAYAGIEGISNVRDKVAAGGWDSITTQDLKTITQALTAIVNAKHISASKKSFEVTDKQGTVMGRAMNKTTGEVVDVPIVKVGEKWVPKDPSMTDASHVLIKEGPLFGKKFVQGTREIVPSAEVSTRLRAGKEFEYNPVTGNKYSIFQRLDLPKPTGQLRNAYSAEARAMQPEASLLGPGNIEANSLKDKRLEFLRSKKRPTSERATELAPYLESRKAVNAATEMPLMRGPEGKMLGKDASKVARQNEIAQTFRADAQKIKDLETGIKTGYPLVRDPATNKFMSVEKSKQYYSDLKSNKPMMTVVHKKAPASAPKPLTVSKGGSKKPTGAPFTTQKGGGKKGATKGKLTVKREQGGVIKGQAGLPSGWEEQWQQSVAANAGPRISNSGNEQWGNPGGISLPPNGSFPVRPRVPMGVSGNYGTGTLLFRDQPAYNSNPTIGAALNVGKLLPSKQSYNGPMAGGMSPIKPLSGNIKIDSSVISHLKGKAKNPTIFDRLSALKMNPKAGLTVSESLRTLFLNNALDKQRETKLYTPQVSDVAETRIGVHGDLLTKSLYDAKANEIRNIRPVSSDARLNAAAASEANKTALGLESQGALGFAQGIEKSRQMDLQNTAMNNQSRKQNADLRSKNLMQGLFVRDKTNKDLDAQKASNLNTLWATQNLDKKRDIYEKENGLKSIAFEQEAAKIEARYPGAMSYWSPSGPKTPEAKAAADAYSKEMLEAKRRIYFEKSGGSLPNIYKHELMLYKEDSKFKKDISTAINKWTEKQSNRAFAASGAASKELNDLVAKLFSK